ncbi:alpha/beta hydrolase family protein [Roseateles sp. BYS78W]|uniref:Alpha/beta hydrolase family protein n=1 Tax=Pelomonas candidula TaxID=3299025 RepID=A0ABW7HHH8_9BURK
MTADLTAGCRLVSFRDAVQGADIPLVLMYPARVAAVTRQFGPYDVSAAWDAEPAGAGLPLVVISHGNNGSPWTLRDLAAHLARAGFAVALPEHVGNSRHDASLAGTLANLRNRPRHVSLAIDAARGDALLGPCLDRGPVGAAGLSIGGYTALAAAGGRPWCGPHESPDGHPHPVDVTPDARIGALVLLAPAVFWFMADGALRGVTQPILMRTGSRDAVTPAEHAATVLNGVPDPARVAHEMVDGAGHFSFLSAFPPAMTRPDFPPSQDPPGFDRLALQPQLFADIAAFLRRSL